jgi:hypothetical protein
MTAIGKLLVFSLFVASLGMLTWATTTYTQRPTWFLDPPPESDIDKGNSPRYYKQVKAEIDSLGRSAAIASEAWGTHLKTLEEREKLRADRKAAYAERIRWAHKGNPNDLMDPMNPNSGKGFYEPVIDPVTKLYDLTLVKGRPKGNPVKGTDGTYLPGVDGLQDSIAGDAEATKKLNDDIREKRMKFDDLTKLVQATEERAIKLGIIRDSVQSELFFLATFEVNVSETRETVFRRDRQLRNRLKSFGVYDP